MTVSRLIVGCETMSKPPPTGCPNDVLQWNPNRDVNFRPALGPRESFALDVGGPDHFGPFFNFARDDLAKIGGTHRRGYRA